ncbi:MAG TPA: DsbA family protein [Solirubrobacteraceae bacterium]|nr:DsbA family protein [Solirubrobacteraceae bacterium]
MGVVHVTYYTDPACPWSWAAEPGLRRLQAEFGDSLEITYVMGGLAREFRKPLETMRHVLDAAEASGMPVDPRVWLDAPPRSSYPASLAVKAAAEQRLDGPYLRVLREGMMAGRRALDTPDALTDAARQVPDLNVERFAIDLRSNAITEAFGADIERARGAAPETHTDERRRVPFPSFEFRGDDGAVHGVYDSGDAGELRAAALAAGASPNGGLPGVEDALRRFGRMATPEVAAVCDLPGPRAAAELWRLASEWRVRPDRVLTGELWTAA